MSALMTKAEFARHRGVGRSAVSNWIKRNQLVIVEGKVDVAASEALLGSTVDPGRGRPPEHVPQPGGKLPKKSPAPSPAPSAPPRTEGGDPLRDLRARELNERAIGQALKNAEAAGDLVPIAEYEARMGGYIKGFCDRIQSEMRANAEALAQESDVRRIRTILDETLHQVRTDFAKRISAGSEDNEE